ncbi:MAG TPA: ABC transporter substrate-binding protein [Roseiflexaceae bacterium]|nr:ABC transporter substrate-binding protein [Roseiflexaceae bacterium]
MSWTFRPTRLLALILLVLSIAACGAPAAPPQGQAPSPEQAATTAPEQAATTAPEQAPAPTAAPAPGQGVMTDVGTPRSETLIFQTFDRKAANPDLHNPLMSGYAIWRGFRELGWGYLWEMDTGTGKSYPELAADMPEVLNAEHTQFRVTLKPGIYWSDGVEFTADDVIYTLDTYFQNKDKLTYFGVSTITNYVKSYKKVDKYTFEVETVNPAYDFTTVMGVYTWGSAFNIVPKHIFEKQADVAAFRNTKPVTLGPYVVKEFDSNGFWQLWERREDWQRSAWGWQGEPKPRYVLYKDFGPEETRVLAFVQNQYDVDTFMSPESIKAAVAQNPAITPYSPTLPYHNMDDACSYGVLMNQHKAPLDKAEVRWALALSLDLQDVGINALSGEFKASPLPMVDTQILRPIYFEPLLPWLNDFQLPDGYKPFNPAFAAELAGRLGEMGLPADQLPQGDEALSKAFGVGWWKYDPAEAEKLFNSVGMRKNAEGFYTLPDGTVWELEFVIPGDWNKVMQRTGFSIADSWRKAGIKVNARQVDNAEFGTVQNTNRQLTTMLNWTNCIFSPNYLNAWRSIQPQYLMDADATETITGNQYRWNNPKVFDLVKSSYALDSTTPEFQEIGRSILKEFVTDMAYINLMNIPTTIPTNSTYWKGFPKADNPYAVPYSWWSSAKQITLKIEPTGQQ